MLLDREGKAVWEYELPGDIPRQFTITDVASFSRWYLEDYPVYVWQHKDGLLVFGCGKDSIVRISTILDGTLMKNAGWNAGLFGVLNLMLLLSLAMGGGVAGLIISNKGLGLYWPYALMLMGMNSNKNEDTLAGQSLFFFLSVLLFFLAFSGISIFLLKKRDVKA